MPDALARAWKIGMIAGLVTISSWLSVGTSSGLSVGGISPQITVAASDGFRYVNYGKAGLPIGIDVMLLAKDATPLFTSDVYVGIISPDGRSTSLVSSPEAPGFPFTFEPVLVTGSVVPFLKNVVLATDAGGRLVIPNFAAGGPEGWYMVYGIIVSAGQDPGDPKRWISSSFFPIQVTSPSQ